ncbi:hypothetical protein C8034_v004107 [Colletotrichum sidae]|uniref:Uncharacterized protein n=1 Tax=Colletotrichum sidae TaxID=1347389 RepID=A0A4R8T8C7_9PEZI|nr:hypothetical protein C8034_v004107 [Colletotrichum sidae]
MEKLHRKTDESGSSPTSLPKHFMRNCPLAPTTPETSQLQPVLNQVTSLRFEKFACCYHCLMPQHEAYCARNGCSPIQAA